MSVSRVWRLPILEGFALAATLVACGASSGSQPGSHARAGRATTAELHAAEHRAMTPEMRRFQDGACRHVPPALRADCPLLGNVVAADDNDDSVILRLSLHEHPHEVLERARCHIAFAIAHEHRGMRKCPLYLHGVTVRPLEQERAIELSVADPALLDELAQRVHDHAGW
jgi:hypothetical protein